MGCSTAWTRLDQVAPEPSLKTEAPGLCVVGQNSRTQDSGLAWNIQPPGPHSPPRYVQKEELCGGREDTHRREGSKGKGQEKEQDGWRGGQGPDSAGIWGWGA